jgi:hypothetical protein
MMATPSNKYGFVPDPQPKGQESLAKRGLKGAARTAKSIGSGVAGGLADTVTMPYNLASTMFNALKESKFAKDLDPASRAMLEAEGFYLGEPGSPDIPTVPSAVDAVDQGVDSITGGYTKTPEDEKSIHEGLKAVGSMASVGGAPKGAIKFGANRIGKTLEKLGSTKARDLAAGGISSGVTSEALERGQNLPAAFGEGIGAGVLANVLFNKKTLNLPAKAAMKTLGLNPKKLKTDALEAAERLGIDLPAAAATDAKLMGLANQAVGAAPVFGDMLRNKMKTASNQFQTGFKDMLEKVGPLKTELVEAEIRNNYKNAKNFLPSDAAIKPTKTLQAIKDIKANLKTFSPAKSEEALLVTLDELEKGMAPLGLSNIPAPVAMLVGTKKSLNETIKWDKSEGTKNLLRGVQKSLLDYIQAYKKVNPAWGKAFDKAERSFEATAKREKLDKLLAGKIEDPTTKEVAYIPLAKLLNDKKYAKQLENTLGSQQFKKLKDFTKVAEAMSTAERNTPNKSGTGPFMAALGLIGSIAKGDFITPLKVMGGGAVLTELLTNKRFLNLATKFAKEPTEPLAQKLNALVKENTGMTSQALMTGLKANGDAEEKKLKIRMYNPDKPSPK